MSVKIGPAAAPTAIIPCITLDSACVKKPALVALSAMSCLVAARPVPDDTKVTSALAAAPIVVARFPIASLAGATRAARSPMLLNSLQKLPCMRSPIPLNSSFSDFSDVAAACAGAGMSAMAAANSAGLAALNASPKPLKADFNTTTAAAALPMAAGTIAAPNASIGPTAPAAALPTAASGAASPPIAVVMALALTDIRPIVFSARPILAPNFLKPAPIRDSPLLDFLADFSKALISLTALRKPLPLASLVMRTLRIAVLAIIFSLFFE